jgi:hypothetical protein
MILAVKSGLGRFFQLWEKIADIVSKSKYKFFKTVAYVTEFLL